MQIWGVLNLSDVLRSVVLSLQNLFSEFVLHPGENYILSHDMQPMKYAKMYVEKSSVQADWALTYCAHRYRLATAKWQISLSFEQLYAINCFI